MKAYTALGMFAFHGLGGGQDHSEAFRLFTEGARQGHDRAICNQACMLKKGTDGVEKNDIQAERLFISLLRTPYVDQVQERLDKIKSRRAEGRPK